MNYHHLDKQFGNYTGNGSNMVICYCHCENNIANILIRNTVRDNATHRNDNYRFVSILDSPLLNTLEYTELNGYSYICSLMNYGNNDFSTTLNYFDNFRVSNNDSWHSFFVYYNNKIYRSRPFNINDTITSDYISFIFSKFFDSLTNEEITNSPLNLISAVFENNSVVLEFNDPVVLVYSASINNLQNYFHYTNAFTGVEYTDYFRNANYTYIDYINNSGGGVNKITFYTDNILRINGTVVLDTSTNELMENYEFINSNVGLIGDITSLMTYNYIKNTGLLVNNVKSKIVPGIYNKFQIADFISTAIKSALSITFTGTSNVPDYYLNNLQCVCINVGQDYYFIGNAIDNTTTIISNFTEFFVKGISDLTISHGYYSFNCSGNTDLYYYLCNESIVVRTRSLLCNVNGVSTDFIKYIPMIVFTGKFIQCNNNEIVDFPNSTGASVTSVNNTKSIDITFSGNVRSVYSYDYTLNDTINNFTIENSHEGIEFYNSKGVNLIISNFDFASKVFSGEAPLSTHVVYKDIDNVFLNMNSEFPNGNGAFFDDYLASSYGYTFKSLNPGGKCYSINSEIVERIYTDNSRFAYSYKGTDYNAILPHDVIGRKYFCIHFKNAMMRVDKTNYNDYDFPMVSNGFRFTITNPPEITIKALGGNNVFLRNIPSNRQLTSWAFGNNTFSLFMQLENSSDIILRYISDVTNFGLNQFEMLYNAVYDTGLINSNNYSIVNNVLTVNLTSNACLIRQCTNDSSVNRIYFSGLYRSIEVSDVYYRTLMYDYFSPIYSNQWVFDCNNAIAKFIDNTPEIVDLDNYTTLDNVNYIEKETNEVYYAITKNNYTVNFNLTNYGGNTVYLPLGFYTFDQLIQRFPLALMATTVSMGLVTSSFMNKTGTLTFEKSIIFIKNTSINCNFFKSMYYNYSPVYTYSFSAYPTFNNGNITPVYLSILDANKNNMFYLLDDTSFDISNITESLCCPFNTFVNNSLTLIPDSIVSSVINTKTSENSITFTFDNFVIPYYSYSGTMIFDDVDTAFNNIIYTKYITENTFNNSVEYSNNYRNIYTVDITDNVMSQRSLSISRMSESIVIYSPELTMIPDRINNKLIEFAPDITIDSFNFIQNNWLYCKVNSENSAISIYNKAYTPDTQSFNLRNTIDTRYYIGLDISRNIAKSYGWSTISTNGHRIFKFNEINNNQGVNSIQFIINDTASNVALAGISAFSGINLLPFENITEMKVSRIINYDSPQPVFIVTSNCCNFYVNNVPKSLPIGDYTVESLLDTFNNLISPISVKLVDKQFYIKYNNKLTDNITTNCLNSITRCNFFMKINFNNVFLVPENNQGFITI